jgi:pyridinium-3,5-bisthiocarboxylic acid mononucleotide nickel chelatase
MTRAAYFDCPSGVSGDMILGALLDAGLPLDDLCAALSTLPLEGYTLAAEPVRRGALGATRALVEVQREEHGQRRLRDVLEIIAAGGLPDPVKTRAGAVFERLAAAEAHVHRIAPDAVHFHEVGAVDAIVDVAGACVGLHLLGVREVYASPLPLGRGSVGTAHGPVPLPAPAVLELLARAKAPTMPHEATLELVTPTGAAILTTLARFEQPRLRLARIGYGAGGREQPEPNVLRVWLGEREGGEMEGEQLLVLEANVDDMPGELFGHALEFALAAGALDAWCTPLTMKKSRPAAMLSVLCRPTDRAALLGLLLRETSTFGVRVRDVTRYATAREAHPVETPFGAVQVKLKILDGAVAGAAPEYEDCRRLAAACGVPLPQVYAAALAAAAPLLGASPVTS